MKKCLAVTLVALMSMSLLAGCGESSTSTNKLGGSSNSLLTGSGDSSNELISKDLKKKYGEDPFAYNPKDYVELGNISSFDVEVTEAEYEFKQENFDAVVQEILDVYIPYTELKDQTVVKENSTVNIDYVGKINGEAFQGGTSSGQIINVAGDASRYIEGFTAALVGHKVGETFDANLKFPEAYGNADLAGKDVVFTMTINYICEKTTIDNVTDSVIMSTLFLPTKDEFLKTCEQIYETQRNNERTTAINKAVLDKVIEGATVKSIPEELKNGMVGNQVELYTEYAAGYQVTLEEFITKYLGSTIDDMYSELGSMAEKSISQEMILTAAADELGIEIDEAEFEEFIKEGMSSAQVTDAATFLSQNCTDSKTMDGYSNLRKQFRCYKAIDELIKRVNVISK